MPNPMDFSSSQVSDFPLLGTSNLSNTIDSVFTTKNSQEEKDPANISYMCYQMKQKMLNTKRLMTQK